MALEIYIEGSISNQLVFENIQAENKMLSLGIHALSLDFFPHHPQDFTELVSKFPDDDKPAFFGLPANIERSSQRIISGQVISQLKVLRRSDEAADKFDMEKWNTELGPILTLWKKLNQV